LKPTPTPFGKMIPNVQKPLKGKWSPCKCSLWP
jgi:hypothetical protein